ncbi:MAG TPA: hypothetical protein DE061_01555 [Clostridiales bacterium]|nr:hypothetical protein [Clostridiales bacterium]
MPTKENGNGKQQEYDASTGRYSSGGGLLNTAKQLGIQIPNRDLTQSDISRIKGEVAEKKRLQSSEDSGKIKLSKQEWAQYYKIIGDEQHGDFVYHTQDGGRAVRLENKIVFDDGNFENPTVKDTYQFASNEEMNYAFSYWARKGVLR